MTTRGTSNSNARGSTADRRARREYLIDTYRADVKVATLCGVTAPTCGGGFPACRCYRCGVLLTVDTVTVDRIIPGCEGGTYARANIRPACMRCNSITGTALREARKAAA